MASKKITTDKPWRCINCKTPATAVQERCGKCNDPLKPKVRK